MIEFRTDDAAGAATRIQLAGRLDSIGVGQVEAPLIARIDAGAGPVVFDLSQLSFVSSLGIRLLMSAARGLQKRGREMVMFGVQPHVAQVFEIVTLGDLIPIVGTEAEALHLTAARIT